MIEAKGIGKSFGVKRVLEDINLRFEPGKTNLIIGRSGSGKTVFLKILVGLLQPDEGSVFFQGKRRTHMSPRERVQLQRQIGMLFQGGALFDSQNVLENVIFPLRMFSDMTIKQCYRRGLECLHRVNLPDAAQLQVSDLSGGMRKRVAIARAIVLQPKFLFCDEPNSGLDPQTSLLIDSLIHDITEEYQTTTIVNTHDMNSVLAIGDTVAFLYQGRVHWQGTNREVLTTQNAELNDFVFATPMARRLKHD